MIFFTVAGRGQMYGRGGPAYGGPAPPYGQQPATTPSQPQTASYGRGTSTLHSFQACNWLQESTDLFFVFHIVNITVVTILLVKINFITLSVHL